MQRLPFSVISNAVKERLDFLNSLPGAVFFKTGLNKELLWHTYLNSFPEEVNGVYRERKWYDGNYDKNFVRGLGNVVVITPDLQVHTIWDFKVEGYFQQVVDALHTLVMTHNPLEIFLTDSPHFGAKSNIDPENGLVWDHFYYKTPSNLFKHSDVSSLIGDFKTHLSMFKTSMELLTLEAGEIVLELINTNSIYRGSEFKTLVQNFLKDKKEYLKAENKEVFSLFKVASSPYILRYRQSVIGTLIEDISNGVPLEKAVNSFENKVAPSNYKRTSAVVTKSMIENAKKAIDSLGYSDSIYRREATLEDVDTSNLLFTAHKEVVLDPFESLSEEASRRISSNKKLSNVDTVSLKDFIEKIIPTSTTISVVLENNFKKNLVSLIKEDIEGSKNLFKWSNTFSWSYSGNITDAIQERVKTAGGQVEGVMRVSLAWHNTDDLDIYIVEPIKDHRIYYGAKKGLTGGVLDIDANSPTSTKTETPVENVVWKNTPKDGVYKVYVNQYQRRQSTNTGYSLQIALEGVLHNLSTNVSPAPGATVHVCDILCKNGEMSLQNINDSFLIGTSQVDSWGLKSQTIVPVKAIMKSPNFWNDSVGNEHLFLFLEDCVSDEEPLGFYNEFLKEELTPHRKVLELLSNRIPVKKTENALAGVGFSLTKKETFTVQVKGKFTKTYKVVV